MRPGLSVTVSTMRLAVALLSMAKAETLQEVINIKDKAKAMGLMPKDLEALRLAFDVAKARFR